MGHNWCSCMYLLAVSFSLHLVSGFLQQPLQFVRLSRHVHTASDEGLLELSSKSDQQNFENQLLEPFMKVRVPGTPEHEEVREHIVSYMQDLNWDVEEDSFVDQTPQGEKPFVNVIATQNPDAPRRLTLACHYDSKYFQQFEFVAMSDSAVPCAMLLDLARVMQDYIQAAADDMENDVSLQLIFFDGEEAFHHWTSYDSLYGARHLAEKMKERKRSVRRELNVSDLDRMDMLVLLDLIGAANPTFKNWFPETSREFNSLQEIERRLIKLDQFTPASQFSDSNVYFVGGQQRGQGIQDDHIPFLHRGVPIVHLISHPFPSVWHTERDNMDAFDYNSVDNINKVLRVFVAQQLNLHL